MNKFIIKKRLSESEHDAFNTGYSSTSISAALGFARARDIKNEDYSVISVIGDGALTGGMAFEAFCLPWILLNCYLKNYYHSYYQSQYLQF